MDFHLSISRALLWFWFACPCCHSLLTSSKMIVLQVTESVGEIAQPFGGGLHLLHSSLNAFQERLGPCSFKPLYNI